MHFVASVACSFLGLVTVLPGACPHRRPANNDGFCGSRPTSKGNLEDDFGVALSTQWLFDRLGGFADIVDGRRFILQFAHLLPRKTKPATAKVGPTKAPDFVIKDLRGRWHVLECKGTQSGHANRNKFLSHALAQKQVIQVTGRLRGERLAAGLSLSNERSTTPTELRVIDPKGKPLIQLGENKSRNRYGGSPHRSREGFWGCWTRRNGHRAVAS